MLVNKLFKIAIAVLIIFSITCCSKGVNEPVALIQNVVVVDNYITFDFLLEENQDYVITNLAALIIDSSGNEVFNMTTDNNIIYGMNEGLYVFNLNPTEIYNIQIVVDYEKDGKTKLNVLIDEYEFRTTSFVQRVSGVVSELDISIDQVSFDINVEKMESVVISDLSVVVVNSVEEEFYKFSDVTIGENLDYTLVGLKLDEDYTIYLLASYELNGIKFTVFNELETFSNPLWDVSPVVQIDVLSLDYDEIYIDFSVTENQYIAITGISINLSDTLGTVLVSLDENNGLNSGVNKDLVFRGLELNNEYYIDVVVEYTDVVTGVTNTFEYDTHMFNTPNPTVLEFNQDIVQSILGTDYTITEVTHLYNSNETIEYIYIIKNEAKQTVAYAYSLILQTEEYYIKSLVIINLNDTFRYVSIYDDNESNNMVEPYYSFEFGSLLNGVSLNQVSYDIDHAADSAATYDAIMVSLEAIASYHLTEVSLIDPSEVIINGKINLTTDQLQTIFPSGEIFEEVYVDRLQSESIKNIYRVHDNTNTHIGYVFVLRIIGKEDIIEYAIGVTTNSLSNNLVILYSNETWEFAELYGNYDGSYGAFYNTVWLENFEGFDLVNDSVSDIDAVSGVSVTTGSVLVSFEDIIEYYLNNLR